MGKNMNNQKVLIVEDEMMVLIMIEDMLEEFGCQSSASAATSEQAINLLDRETFDAAILDINLNGKRSYEVAEALLLNKIPFVFCSGNAISDLPPQFRNIPFLRKPFSYQALTSQLIVLLGGR